MQEWKILTPLELSVLAGLAQHVGAQKYPVKPIRIVVGFQPGGGSDTVARPLAPKLTESLVACVIIEMRPA